MTLRSGNHVFAAIISGTIDGAVIGGTTPAAITGTTITGNSFVPNSATVPTNGVYLPASNTVGVAANSLQVARFVGGGTGAAAIQFQSASSGGTPVMIATDSGSNASLLISAKGTGSTYIWSDAGSLPIAEFARAASAANSFKFTPAATGSDPQLTVSGGGNLLLATAAPATNAVTGLTRLGVTAGTPTGSVSDGCIVGDSSGSKIWIRLGSAWKSVAVA